MLRRAELLLLILASPAVGQGLNLVPSPRGVKTAPGTFVLDETVVCRVRFPKDLAGAAQRSLRSAVEAHARVFVRELELLTGVQVPTAKALGPKERRISLQLLPPAHSLQRNMASKSEYLLAVDEDEVFISSRSVEGLGYGTATLLQLVSHGGLAAAGQSPRAAPKIPCVRIADRPESGYRSLSIDVARSPHSIPVLEDVVRLARLYKIRYVQLHLTDDQNFTFPFAPVTSKLKNNAVYDRQALQKLVAYADVRGVTLIPEIDLPGHSSRLRQSGYLPGAKSDADVASPENYARIHALIADVAKVFHSAPYIHLGGDESGAGRALVPFLSSMNQMVRSLSKQMIVWEGFHGAPIEALPPTGPNAVLVAAWESSYNAPWDLLKAGYQLINASWKPLYVVGGGSRVHPGSTNGRSWSPAQLADWDKDSFWHWEPGRPVFEDRGPEDPNRNDGRWSARLIGRQAQIVGAQISVWEQRESSLVADLRHRVPVVAERLWRGTKVSAVDLLRRAAAVDRLVWPIVQPIEILPASATARSTEPLFRTYRGDQVQVTLHNRTAVRGSIRYGRARFSGNHSWIDFPRLPAPAAQGEAYGDPVAIKGGGVLRAQLVDSRGRAVGAGTWARFINWPDRVRVTNYATGRRAPKAMPTLASLTSLSPSTPFRMPMLRGPLAHDQPQLQVLDATVMLPAPGAYTLWAKTQSGRASVYLDLNGDGKWTEADRQIEATPTSEKWQSMAFTAKTRRVRLRVLHATNLPRPVLAVGLEGPQIPKRKDITEFLELLPAGSVTPGKKSP